MMFNPYLKFVKLYITQTKSLNFCSFSFSVWLHFLSQDKMGNILYMYNISNDWIWMDGWMNGWSYYAKTAVPVASNPIHSEKPWPNIG